VVTNPLTKNYPFKFILRFCNQLIKQQEVPEIKEILNDPEDKRHEILMLISQLYRAETLDNRKLYQLSPFLHEWIFTLDKELMLNFYIRLISLCFLIENFMSLFLGYVGFSVYRLSWFSLAQLDFLWRIIRNFREYRSRRTQLWQLAVRANIPGFARQLIALGEERNGRYAFITNPFTDEKLFKSRLLRKIFYVLPLI
jgi:hypothetical protein